MIIIGDRSAMCWSFVPLIFLTRGYFTLWINKKWLFERDQCGNGRDQLGTVYLRSLFEIEQFYRVQMWKSPSCRPGLTWNWEAHLLHAPLTAPLGWRDDGGWGLGGGGPLLMSCALTVRVLFCLSKAYSASVTHLCRQDNRASLSENVPTLHGN